MQDKAHRCLNCGQELSSKFCPNCGQKSSTHRYSLKHYIEHDLVHGVLHFDKGFFYTVKELFTKPGHSVREFINGKRTKHFNAFTFLLLVLGANYFIGKYAQFDYGALADLQADEVGKSAMSEYNKLVQEYP